MIIKNILYDFPLEIHQKVLKNLRYKWKKSNSFKKVLVERNIIFYRGKYIRTIHYYRMQNKNTIMWIRYGLIRLL